ncbi:carboxylating.nicotinate-nucleotide diphosphorylase [Candidatus Peregrinibacteria bacterium]|nr:carboxylating.nicotinate-nucleotide diphosphorylase [Candidatus Peregrinibacteria bacterium]
MAHDQSKFLNLSNPLYIQSVIQYTELEIKKDLGKFGDITTKAFFKKSFNARAKIFAKQKGVLAGADEIKYFLKKKKIEVVFLKRDGDFVKNGDVICAIHADIRDILKIERIILNLLGRLSGVASLTHRIVEKVKRINKKVLITPTRKTLWGLLDKRACAIGGGGTHRLGLYDAILIKDNHLDAVGRDISSAIRRFFPYKGAAKFIEIEVESEAETIVAAKEFKRLKDLKLCFLPCFIMFDKIILVCAAFADLKHQEE